MAINLKNSNSFWVLGLVMAVAGIVAAGVLAWVSQATEAPRREAKDRKLRQSLSIVLPAGAGVGEVGVIFDGVEFFPARVGGELVGFAASGATQLGYAGTIKGLVGLTPEGTVITLAGGRGAVVVTENGETPGLGSKVCNRTEVKTLKSLFAGEKKSEALPANPALDSFAGKRAGSELKITKDGGEIEFITGATVSSRAVTDLVNNVLNAYAANREKILEAIK